MSDVDDAGAPPGRVRLAVTPTPLERADRLGAALGLPAAGLWVKRDDLTGLAGGGNKARKLEVLCADALTQGCDVLVTGGGPQSNHARMTAAAARRLGLDCVLALAGDPPEEPEGNVVLDRLLGATVEWLGPVGHDGTEAGIAAACRRLARAGRHPYLVPVGGSSPVGALGYVAAADELDAEAPADALVVVAAGSGGTQAGLAAGFGDHGRVVGVDVGARSGLAPFVAGLAVATAELADRPAPAGEPVVVEGYAGPGYGAPTDGCRRALELAARSEGLVLDPVYTGKAMAALADGALTGLADGRPVVFLHTGGLPALFTGRYRPWFDGGAAASP